MHVAAVCDKTAVTLYADGELAGSVALDRAIDPAPEPLQLLLGTAANPIAHGFRGEMDDVRVWNRPLTQAEIQNVIDRRLPLTGDEPGLLAWWSFNVAAGAADPTTVLGGDARLMAMDRPRRKPPELPREEETVSISGFARALDGETPQSGLLVEALAVAADGSLGGRVQADRTDQIGLYEFYGLAPGDYAVRCFTGRRYLYYGEADGGGFTTVHVSDPARRARVDFQCAPFVKGRWNRITVLDGLPALPVYMLAIGGEGRLWTAGPHWLAWYSGHDLTKLSIELEMGRQLSALVTDPEGGVCAGTEAGELLFLSADGLTYRASVPGGAIISGVALEGPDTLWAATVNGLYRGVGSRGETGAEPVILSGRDTVDRHGRSLGAVRSWPAGSVYRSRWVAGGAALFRGTRRA